MNLTRKIIFVVSVICLTVWASINLLPPQAKQNNIPLSPEIKAALVEANANFTYKGSLIHPHLIKEFESWYSDNCPPVIVSIDVAAAAKARNEYDSDAIKIDGSRVIARSDDGTFYQYEWLGRLENGIHILKTADYGEGSGVFTQLVFVKFTTDFAYDEDGSRRERLLLTVMRDFILGDRDDGSIEIKADRVVISASRYRPEPIVLKF